MPLFRMSLFVVRVHLISWLLVWMMHKRTNIQRNTEVEIQYKERNGNGNVKRVQSMNFGLNKWGSLNQSK